MDELYITASTSDGSDMVFETPHIDGPFGLLPFTLLRCVYAIKGSDAIETIIYPRKGVHDGHHVMLKDSEHIMFDYNRDTHYIVNNQSIPVERQVLKLHFVKKQSCSKTFALANARWNTFARIIFNISKKPKNKMERILSVVINCVTQAYPNVTSYIFTACEKYFVLTAGSLNI
tara:strand:+ start:1224 stop:1745 length:522 start_codon:yes stop_codon:yes gene_type:complete